MGAGLAAASRAVEEITSQIAKAVNTAISSSWAIFVAATVALFLFFFGDTVGLDRQRVDLHFLVDAATFLMVFVIEHTQSREVAALHTKLDAVIRALDADTTTVGIEELSQKEIQEIRDRRRERFLL
jgi:low affinity Fe/Cu permease